MRQFVEGFRRAASYVDKILKGAKPGDPLHRAADEVRARHQSQDRQGARPDDPPLVLVRADQVIE
jgi:hypothetical protein